LIGLVALGKIEEPQIKNPIRELININMTGSVAIDVVIALVFVYLLYSLLASIIQEIIASNIIRLRAKVLEECIRRLLDDDDSAHGHSDLLSSKFYQMPLIKYLGQSKGKKPAYLASRNFSKAMLDILIGPNPEPGDDFRKKIDQSLSQGINVSASNRITGGDSIEYIRSLWASVHGDIDKFRIELEKWFDDAMDRATGWYKRKIQVFLFFIGLGIAVLFNVDTIAIVQKLSSNPKLTAQIVSQAENFIKAHPNLDKELEQLKKDTSNNKPGSAELKSTEAAYKKLKAKQDSLLVLADSLVKNDIKNINGLLGTGIQSYTFKGTGFWETTGFFLLSVAGWLLTALALSLGAPFWFDLLNKLMKLRASVPVSPDDKSKTSPDTSEKKTITIKG
jgi:hypothetical protein